MQAVILVGGAGLRLRPLTATTPKPLIPLANRPLIEHIVRWLEGAGVDAVMLLAQYRAAAFDRWLHHWRGIDVRVVEEPVPLGTAGAVANVAHLLRGTTAVINGDNITNLDLGAMLRLHRKRGAVATIAIDRVDDPSGRGVVVADAMGRVARFQEKPAPGTALAATVNTGSYLIEPAALAGVGRGQPAMWETDLFPNLIVTGQPVYAFETPHLWLDAGTPSGYFGAQQAILTGAVSEPAGEARGGVWTERQVSCDGSAQLQPPAALGYGTIIAAEAVVEGPCSIGAECHVLRGARVSRSSVWDGTLIEAGASILNSIIGYNCYVGEGARVHGALLGDGVTIKPGGHVAPGSRVEPGSVVDPA